MMIVFFPLLSMLNYILILVIFMLAQSCLFLSCSTPSLSKAHSIPLPLSDPFQQFRSTNKTVNLGMGGCQSGTCADFQRNWYQFNYSTEPMSFLVPLNSPFVMNFLDATCANYAFQISLACGASLRNIIISSTGTLPQNYATAQEAINDPTCASTIGLGSDLGNAYPLTDSGTTGPFDTCTMTITSSAPGSGFIQVQPYYGTQCSNLNLFGNRYYLIQPLQYWVDQVNGLSPEALCRSFDANLLYYANTSNINFVLFFFTNSPCSYRAGSLVILGNPSNLLGTAQGTTCNFNNLSVVSPFCRQLGTNPNIPVICFTVQPQYLGQYFG